MSIGDYGFLVHIGAAALAAYAVARKKRANAALRPPGARPPVPAKAATSPGAPATPALPPDDYERMLVQTGDRDGAVKAYRSRTGAAANEARAAIARVR
jgi:hypothetical protein